MAGFSFERVNSLTHRIDRPSKRGVGWLMEVAWPGEARQRWVARVGNQASESLSFEGAKQAAAAMLRQPQKTTPRDWIKELNQIAANEVDRAYLAGQKRTWPVNLMGGQRTKPPAIDRKLRQAILDTERVLTIELVDEVKPAGDYPLEYDENGYPKLPDCLDRSQ